MKQRCTCSGDAHGTRNSQHTCAHMSTHEHIGADPKVQGARQDTAQSGTTLRCDRLDMDYLMLSLSTCTAPCSHTLILYKGQETGRDSMSASVSKGVRRMCAALFGGCSLERHGHLVIQHTPLVVEYPPLMAIHTAPLVHSQHQHLPLRLTLMSPVRCLLTRLCLQTPQAVMAREWRGDS